jgi:uncharacterized protein DUF6708
VIKSARQLFDAIGDKLASQFPRLLLSGVQGSGYRPSQSGAVELHGKDYLTLKTATAETKGMIAGCCFFIALPAVIMFFLTALFGNPSEFSWWPLFAFLALGFIPFLWELYRPFPLPIVFNRRTQEIYYDLNGKLYHAPWEGIEAVAYEYRNVNQYAGSMVQGNLEIILYRFGDPEDRIALNIGGHTSGKRIQTLASLWEYLRAYMNNGPWFDDLGNPAVEKTPFIVDQLKKSGFTMRGVLDSTKKEYARSKTEGVAGPGIIDLMGGYAFQPIWFMQDITYKLCRRKSHKQWPEVVRERLKPDGPDTRLMDIEEDYVKAQKQREEELQARVRARFPD